MSSPFSHRHAPSVLAVSLALLFAACSKDSPRGPAKRVILITCDTLRADRLGVYGYERPTSPHLDTLAREAVVFDEAYSCAPWTGPALSSLLSGRLPDEVGVSGGNRFSLPPEARTLAEIARDAGVRTAAVVSNWVLRRPDPALGDAGVAQGFETFDDEMTAREQNREAFERTAPATTDAAIAWLSQKARADEPFFLWVHYQDPHGPYTPPADYVARFERAAGDEAPLALGKTHKGKDQLPAYQALGAERRPEVYRARYDAEIAYFDEHLGRLLEWLRAKSWYDDALIVFSADHGESLGEEGYWFCHGENVRREVVRVPLVVRFPRGADHVAAEQVGEYARVATLAGHLDLWPTILAALGLEAHANRGVSLFESALPTGRVNVQTLAAPDDRRRATAVSDARYRLVVDATGARRLYDVDLDPYETRDLAAADPARVLDLVARERAFLARDARPPLPTLEARAGGATEKALGRLGYTEGEVEGDD